MSLTPTLLTDLDALRWQLAMGVDEALLDSPAALGVHETRHSGEGRNPSTSTPSPSMDSGLRRNDAVNVADPPPTPITHPTTDLSKLATLAELRAAMEGLQGLSIKETAMSFVFGEGIEKPPVMLIGEAPGEEEDRTGRPFVGRAGQLLEKMLAAIGLTREQVYITNVLPWRPPGNRTPKADEVATCLPYLMRHIELVRPNILLLMGGPAAKALLGKEESVTRLRGTWHSYHSTGLPESLSALVTYHPAYLLRSPAQKRESWRDLRLLKKKIGTVQD